MNARPQWNPPVAGRRGFAFGLSVFGLALCLVSAGCDEIAAKIAAGQRQGEAETVVDDSMTFDPAPDVAWKAAPSGVLHPSVPPQQQLADESSQLAAVDTDAPTPPAAPALAPNAPPASPPPTLVAAPAASSQPVRLRAGVALPQSLPTGTAMSFSVDYQFTQGPPKTNVQYVWVIVNGAGEAAPVGLKTVKQKGTLQTFVLEWKPRQGPFRCFLAEVLSGSPPRRISDTVSMR